MPICPSCRVGYEVSEPQCPKCGAAKPIPGAAGESRQRCSDFSLVCLRFAQVAAFVSVILVLFFSLRLLWQGRTLEGLIGLLITTPVSIGGFISFGLVIRYAKYE